MKQWGILQPIIFAAIGIVLAYVTGRELSGGSRLAGLFTALLTAVLPAATERTVLGYIEKEGVALVPILLYVYFYSKLVKSISSGQASRLRKTAYMLITALAASPSGYARR